MYRSIRRTLLEDFVEESIGFWSGTLIDIGGERSSYRGKLNVDELKNIVRVVLNPDPRANPDHLGYAEELPFQSSEFDYALLVEVLEHLEQPESALEELARVLKPQGQAVVSMPFAYRVHGDPADFTRWTEDKLRLATSHCGLKVIEFRWLGSGASAVFDALQAHLQSGESKTRFATALVLALRLLKKPIMTLDPCARDPKRKPAFSGGWAALLEKH